MPTLNEPSLPAIQLVLQNHREGFQKGLASPSVGVPDARRVSNRAVVRKHRDVEVVDLPLVQIRRDDTFFKIIEDNVLYTATKVAERFFVELRPHLLAGFPDDAAETRAPIAQSHHKQPWLPIAPGLRIKGRRALSVVDLSFIRQKLKTVELLRIDVTQRS